MTPTPDPTTPTPAPASAERLVLVPADLLTRAEQVLNDPYSQTATMGWVLRDLLTLAQPQPAAVFGGVTEAQKSQLARDLGIDVYAAQQTGVGLGMLTPQPAAAADAGLELLKAQWERQYQEALATQKQHGEKDATTEFDYWSGVAVAYGSVLADIHDEQRRAALLAAPAPQAQAEAGAGAEGEPPAELWRHVKTGRIYATVDLGVLQSSGGPVPEGAELVIYQDVDSGAVWLRPLAEFRDGRFEPLTDTATLAAYVADAQAQGDQTAQVDR